MIRTSVALPVGVLFLAVAIPVAAQSFAGADGPLVAPRAVQSPTGAQDPSAFVVKPQLTDEQLADLEMVRKDYRSAAEIYRRLSEQQPRNAVYLNKLGIALHQQTALSQALKYYERAVKADPSYADAQNNIGTIWYQRKKYGKAVRAYEKAIKMRNDMAVLYSNLGYAYFGEKKYEESIAAFRQALAIDPKLFETNGSRSGSILQDRSVEDRGKFYFLLAKSFAQANNLDRCLFYLRKAKEEGFTSMSQLKTDPAFAAVLKDPIVQELLAPKPVDTAQP
ncbi:MAG TPA: tetratricopeptide repeat protein [Candidatus Acidoferrales bacterium]|nr:tetratricopeptide repeat protein [Candidatus Acidoferrales bacterium]